MHLLAAERIKLFSTRSPWWCLAATIGLTVAFGAAVTANTRAAEQVTVELTQLGYQFGLAVILVMAALTITTEYRFSTIRTTFQAVPGRMSAVLAKTSVVALTAGAAGLVAGFGSLGLAKALRPSADLALDGASDWRAVTGTGLVFAVAAVIAIAVGTLTRQTAGAVALLLSYALLVEDLVQFIPSVGADIHPWLPFQLAARFLAGDPAAQGMPGPWGSFAVYTGYAVVLYVIALVAARKRDA